MKEAKHTPGPWSIGAEGTGNMDHPCTIPVQSLDSRYVAEVWADVADKPAKANAALIAAAPELLEALKAARTNVAYAHQPENCGDHCRNNCRDCVLRNTLEEIDAAIAKAEGH